MAQLLIHNREHLAIKIQQIQQLQPNITVAPENLFRLAARMVLMVEAQGQSRVLKETPHTTLKDPTETPSLGLVTIHIIMVLQVAPNIMVLMVEVLGRSRVLKETPHITHKVPVEIPWQEFTQVKFRRAKKIYTF